MHAISSQWYVYIYTPEKILSKIKKTWIYLGMGVTHFQQHIKLRRASPYGTGNL